MKTVDVKRIKELQRTKSEYKNEINIINKEIERIGREEKLKELKSYIGKYYKHVETNQLFHVFGVDEKQLDCWVEIIGIIGRGKDAWLSFEVQKNIYSMNALKPISKNIFEAAMNKIKTFIDTNHV
jgi:hypothetical protein